MSSLRTSESRWGGPRVALAAILGLAAALRLTGIQYGLPFGNLLNPDEESIVPRAWAMTHGSGPDPRWFDYPTLLLYVLAPFEWFADEPSFLIARIVVVALALGSIAATWWLARRAYGPPVAGAVAAAIVAVATTHVAYSRMSVTDVPLTLGVALALALMVRGPVEVAGIAVGVATGFKYPGVFLLAPLVVAGWKQWWRLAGAVVLAIAAFLVTTPFVVKHPGDAWDDLTRVNRLAREGWLGFEHDHWAGVAFSAHLWHAIGPALVVALVGLVAALVRRSRADLVLATFVVVYFLDLLTLHAHFDRYVLPLVPPLAALAARMRSLAPVTLLLLVIPLAFSIRDTAKLTRKDTRVAAYDWIEEHVPKGSLVAADPSTPELKGYSVIPLQLPGPGRPFDRNRDARRLRDEGVEYVLVTGAVEDRVVRARDRYPLEARFNSELANVGEPIYTSPPGDELSGPWVALYHLRR